jgi:hypothetical protein
MLIRASLLDIRSFFQKPFSDALYRNNRCIFIYHMKPTNLLLLHVTQLVHIVTTVLLREPG